MIWFTIIAIIIMFVLWKSTAVYGTTINRRGDVIPDKTRSKPLDFTYLHLIGLLLLLIPWFNIAWFIILIGWYIKRASYDADVRLSKDAIFWSPDKIINLFDKIYNFLNKKIL